MAEARRQSQNDEVSCAEADETHGGFAWFRLPDANTLSLTACATPSVGNRRLERQECAAMALQIIGAGIGRTGTHSLKVALERLLGGPCYHMVEVFGHPEHVPQWHAAMRDEAVDWPTLFAGYVATVDWPGGGVWQPIAEAFPDALILLSSRRTADEWYTSASRTIFPATNQPPPGMDDWNAMTVDMIARVTPDWHDAEASKAGYERHNAEVRARVPADRLIDWQPPDGWGPLCAALDVPEPDEPFPVTNTTDEFRQMAASTPGLRAPENSEPVSGDLLAPARATEEGRADFRELWRRPGGVQSASSAGSLVV